jgi:hypothetical protein
MNAETIRAIRKQITPELADLLRKIGKHHDSRSLVRLLAATDEEARQLVIHQNEIYQSVVWRTPGWLEAGYNCTKDADIVPYALAEALDQGGE